MEITRENVRELRQQQARMARLETATDEFWAYVSNLCHDHYSAPFEDPAATATVEFLEAHLDLMHQLASLLNSDEISIAERREAIYNLIGNLINLEQNFIRILNRLPSA